jgi:hypothetical protein
LYVEDQRAVGCFQVDPSFQLLAKLGDEFIGVSNDGDASTKIVEERPSRELVVDVTPLRFVSVKAPDGFVLDS